MAVTLEPIETFTKIVIDRSPPSALDAATQRKVDHAWDALCETYPRYFNGPMLSFERFDQASGVVNASVQPYKHHAVRDHVPLSGSLLAITAIVVADDRILLGKRSNQTHRYSGLWELGPSGGIDLPTESNQIDRAGLIAEAVREVQEEAGVAPEVLDERVVAIVHDGFVGSTDLAVVLNVQIPERIDINWEFEDNKWVSLPELAEWCERNPDELIPTTVALARFLHQNQS